jgi:hypothetical protein
VLERPFLALAFASVLALSLATSGRADETFLKLDQQSCTRGKMNVYISKNAIFIDGARSGYSIVCKAPDWKLVIYSPVSKRFYEADRKSWMHTSPVNLMDLLSTKINTMKVSDCKQEKFLKHNVTVMKMFQTTDKHLRDSVVQTSHERGFYYVTDDFKVEKPIGDVIVWLYKLPPYAPARGVPLKFTYIDNSRKIFTSLNTLSIEQVKFDTKKLSVPAGYERASSEALVLVDKGGEGALEELWGVRSTAIRNKTSKP